MFSYVYRTAQKKRTAALAKAVLKEFEISYLNFNQLVAALVVPRHLTHLNEKALLLALRQTLTHVFSRAMGKAVKMKRRNPFA